MCCHGRSVRVPCGDCAESYHRLISIDTVDTWAAFVLSDPSVVLNA